MSRNQFLIIVLFSLVAIYFVVGISIFSYLNANAGKQITTLDEVINTLHPSNNSAAYSNQVLKNISLAPKSPSPENYSNVIPKDISNETSIDSFSTSAFMLNLMSSKSLDSKGCLYSDYLISGPEFKKYWNYTTYGKCSMKGNDSVEINGDTVIATCAGNVKPIFTLDDRLPRLEGKIKLIWKNDLSGIQKGEFVFTKCQNNTYAHVFNRYKPAVAEKAKALANSLSNSTRQLSVVFLVLDTTSRNNVFRSLPRTYEFLNNTLNTSKYSFYDFKHTTAKHYKTVYNMAPILYGEEFADIAAAAKSKKINLLKYQKDKAIWHDYSRFGYVTMFSYDSVWQALNLFMSNEIVADHAFLNFWKVAYQVYGYHDHMNSQRCAGLYNYHYYQYNYTYQFLKNYKGNNKFAYAHTNAGHESTGNIQTVDDDLLEFLNKTTELFDNPHEDLVIFIISDHGSGAKTLQFDYRAYLESRTPFTFMVINKELEERLNFKKALEHNQDKMIGRLDINLSLKELMLAPYGGLNNEWYLKLKNDYPTKEKVVSLFREKIDDDRQCADVGVEKNFCTCRKTEELDNELDAKIAQESISLLIQFINAKAWKNKICSELYEINIIESEKLMLDSGPTEFDTVYYFELLVNKNTNIRLLVNSATYEKLNKSDSKLPIEDHPISTIEFKPKSIGIQIAMIDIEDNCGESNCIC